MASFLKELQQEALSKGKGLQGSYPQDLDPTAEAPKKDVEKRKQRKSEWFRTKTANTKSPFDISTEEKTKKPLTITNPEYPEQTHKRTRTKTFAQRQKNEAKECALYVQLPGLLHQMDIKGHLQKRIPNACNFTCTVMPRDEASLSTVATLIFPSKNSARRAEEALRRSNKMENMIQLKCSSCLDDLYIHSNHPPVSRGNHTKLKADLESKTEQQVLIHQLKIEEAIKRLSSLNVRNLAVSDIDRVLEERKTLQQKVEELERQQEEFQTCVSQKILCHLDKAVTAKTNSDHKVNQLRLKLGIEMTRLDKAFPIYARRTEIVDVVTNNPVCIVLGETGSGKSTQLPQYLYEAGFGETGMIACTQPRKIAATSLATHVSSEVVSSVGQIVGYKVGMRSKTSTLTKIVYLTDHMLLNEILQDPNLTKYSCVIVDEAHERSIYTDLLLGMIKQCMRARPDLKVIITSATIDPEIFVRYFGGCPVIKVSGRTFPVEVIWQDPEISRTKAFENHMQAAVETTAKIHEVEAEGDILVFLTSALETEKCCTYLSEKLQGRTDYKCMQIHGKLQADEQQAVFDPLPPGKRKIVFATNSAETSVTIPGIKYVVDTGLVKEMRYDDRKSLSSLDTVIISRSSAEQRKGRAGRMSSGKCFRLYTEDDYDKMKTGSLPEILRVHLAQALLKLLDLGVEPLAFDFVESPSDTALTHSMKWLEDLEAVKEKKITDLGKRLAVLPFEPRLGKMLLEGIGLGVPYEAICLAALVTIGSSIFYRSGSEEEKKKSDLLKTRFCHPDGDHFTMLNVYMEWHGVLEKEKNKWCVTNSINARSMRTVRETANEVISALKKEMNIEVKVNFQSPSEIYDKLKSVIFRSSMQNIAVYLGHMKAGYLVPGHNQQAHIHPSSSVNVLGGGQPRWIVFEQLINTSRDFITIVSPVKREQVDEAFEDDRLQFNPDHMEALMVEKVVVKDLGRTTFHDLTGQRFSNLKVIEEELVSQSAKSTPIVCVDADRTTLQVAVYSNCNNAEDVRKVLDGRLKTALTQLRIADKEVPLHEKSASVRAVMGAGGTTNAVLFGGEYRTVFIDYISAHTEIKDIQEWLGMYGRITELNPVKHKLRSNPERWGTATFQDPKCAVDVVRDRKDAIVAKILPCVPGGREVRARQFTLKLSWTRRPLKGFGFIHVSGPENMVRLISYRFLHINGHSVPISINKKDASSIYMRNLPPTTTEAEVKTAVQTVLGEEDCVEKVALIRQSEFQTSEQDFNRMKATLSDSIARLCPHTEASVDLHSPNPKSNFFVGFMRFLDPNKGVEVFNSINGSLIVDGRAVSVQQDLSTDIFVPKYLLSVLSRELDLLTVEIRRRSQTKDFRITEKKSKAGHMYVKIESNSTDTLAEVKRMYDGLLAGETVDFSEFGSEVKFLFRKEGREKLEEIQKQTKTVIRSDFTFQKVSVIGPSEKRDSAINLIQDSLRQLVTHPVKKIDLKGENQPRGLMKKILGQYGIDLCKFRTESGLESVELDFRRQTLTVTGKEKSISSATSLIQNCVSQLSFGNKTSRNQDDRTVDCIVCFCPIDEGQLYRLNLCGHPYCLDCAKLQVQTTVDQRDLPLQCATEGCVEPWCWKDVSEMIPVAGRSLGQLLIASMDSFVSQNKDKFHYCLTPDCPVVFPLSTEGKLFICNVCDLKICTSCKVQYHDGLTCAMYKSDQGDESVSKWLRQDPENHKLCPKCKTPIQKAGGCLHVTCLGCKSHICWKCMQCFTDSQRCYAHLQSDHHTFV